MQNSRSFVVWISLNSPNNLAAHFKNKCSFVVYYVILYKFLVHTCKTGVVL